jgi:hypothetical protein
MSAINNTAGEAVSLVGEYVKREHRIKQEIAVVSFLWLIGCPALCLLVPGDTLYGAPEEQLCGLLSYSVSASMTGQYPKVLGSILAPLFGILVVQRSSNGLCSILKLGWMVRFSPLVSNEGSSSVRKDEKTKLLAAELWKRIERIEYLGYFAGGCLVALVALDAKDFPLLHNWFASAGFFALSQQNRLIGTLGHDYPSVFPDWSSGHAKGIFWLGLAHLSVMYILFFVLGTLVHLNRCDDLLSILESASVKFLGDPTSLRWLASILFWYNEYFFAFTCIYVQLLKHYELRLWEFAGAANLPYMGIVSQFSIRATMERLLGGSSDAEIFLGVSKSNKSKSKVV